MKCKCPCDMDKIKLKKQKKKTKPNFFSKYKKKSKANSLASSLRILGLVLFSKLKNSKFQ